MGSRPAPELRRIAELPFAEPKSTAVAVSPAGTRAAWLDTAGVLHAIEVGRPARSSITMPVANGTTLAFVDEEHLDVFHERHAARRLHLPTGAWTVPRDARRPTPLDPAVPAHPPRLPARRQAHGGRGRGEHLRRRVARTLV
ncbi:MAG: hypothetical protein JNL12_01225 [Planctomycetes bacterium]|nr:hypothetical protein [Planctomycetota bacterium]